MPEVINKVVGTETIDWNELKTYEFNQLKDNSNRDVAKLKNSIVNNGFSFPFYVWNDHRFVIDGTGRRLALLELEKEGYEIKDCPIVRIEADTLKQAKKLVLQVSSKYGEITPESIDDFMIDFSEDEKKELAEQEVELEELDLSLEEVEEVDYSVLDDEEVEDEIKNMADGVKKSIQIEFTPQDYERAYELCKYARDKKVYIGEHLINMLQNIKDGYEKSKFRA